MTEEELGSLIRSARFWRDNPEQAANTDPDLRAAVCATLADQLELLRAERDALLRDRDETAWLVERAPIQTTMPPQWMSMKGGLRHWSGDHADAVRFAREEDAAAFALGWYGHNARATEHMWVPNPAAKSAASAVTAND